jgi:uncharacterized protein YdcH (DUF465 family)
MSHTPNEIADLFPNDGPIIHDLKARDAHFARIADEYHDINRSVHRIEAGIDTVSDAHAETVKKQRLALLDRIARAIGDARTAAAS